MFFRIARRKAERKSATNQFIRKTVVEQLEARAMLAVLFNADFTTVGDGFPDHTTSSPPAIAPASVNGGSTTIPEGRWTLSYIDEPSTDGSSNVFSVKSSGELRAEDWGAQTPGSRFESAPINLPFGSHVINISAVGETIGGGVQSNSSEYFDYFYAINGGPSGTGGDVRTPINLNGDSAGTPVNYSVTNLSVTGPATLTVGYEFEVNGGGDGYVISSFTVSDTSPAAPGLTITESSGSTDVAEGGVIDTYDVVLNASPTVGNTVTVTATPDGQVDLGSGAGTPIVLVFDDTNWSASQQVTVKAFDDATIESTHSGTITHSTTSSDPSYNGLMVSSVVVNVVDDDTSTTARINEFVADHSGSDSDAFVEVYDAPNTSLSGLTVLEIEGDATNRGVIDHVHPLTMTDANGFESFALDAENGTVAYFLVANFSGNLNDDLDTNDDGVFDITPWSSIIDSVATVDDPLTDFAYTTAALIPGLDGITSQYGGASRSADGVDTNFTSEWLRNDSQAGLPSFPDVPGTPGRALNTRNASNQAIAAPPGITIVETSGSTDVTEGSTTDSYTVALDSPPAPGTTVSITVWPFMAQLDLGNGPGNAINLTFDDVNSQIPQTVTVSAIDDGTAEGAHTDVIGHLVSSTDANYNNFAVPNIDVTITDNDNAGINIVESSGSTDVGEGGTVDTYEVILGSTPTAYVDVLVTPDAQIDLGMGAGTPITLTFTPTITSQTVTVVANDDSMDEGLHTGTMTHASTSADVLFDALTIRNVVANITDNDGACTATSTTAVINEFVADHDGTDSQSFVEIFDRPNACLSGLTLLEIEGDGSFGLIDDAKTLTATDENGFAVESFDAENGTVTFLLVEGFTGMAGDDIDTDDDGVIDVTPWTSILDEVATVEDTTTDFAYSSVALSPGFDGDTSQFGGASRVTDGVDSNTVADWVRNNYAGAGFTDPAFSGVTASPGEAINTPGSTNQIETGTSAFTPTDIFISGSTWAATATPYQLTNSLTHSGAGHHGRTLPWAHLDTITVTYTGDAPTAMDLNLSDSALVTTFVGAGSGAATWTITESANPLASLITGVTNQIGPKDDLVVEVGGMSVTVDIVPGDIDGSFLTDVADILDWLNFLGTATTAIPPIYADIDGSGLTDIADVNAIIQANGAASTPLAAPMTEDTFENMNTTIFPDEVAGDVANRRRSSRAKGHRVRRSLSNRDASTASLDNLFAELASDFNAFDFSDDR